MDSKCSLAKSLCIAAMTVAMTATAHAAALRTFVSGFGDDSHTSTNCSHAQPCRTFAMAVTVTSAGGEIEALDPAGYGPITISGPLTLVGLPGAAINAPSGGNGITINAGPNDVIHVQGLLIEGGGVGSNGIVFNSGSVLTIQDCVIRSMTGQGVSFVPTTGTSSMSVSYTYVDNNGGNGILVKPSGSASATAVIDHVQAQYNAPNAYGIALDGTLTSGSVNGTATNTISSNNGGGFFAQGQSLQNSLMVLQSVASYNHTGVQGDPAVATVIISQTTITNNVLGCGGIGVDTYSDNTVLRNVTDGCNSRPVIGKE